MTSARHSDGAPLAGAPLICTDSVESAPAVAPRWAMSRSTLRAAVRPLLFGAGLAVVGYLIWELGPGAVWDAFRRLSWRVLIVLVFPAWLFVLLDTLGWRLTFTRPPRSVLRLLAVRLAGDAVNLSTPTASVGGEPVKAFLLRPEVAPRDALASVIADKTTLVASQVMLLAVGLLAGLALLPLSHPLMLTMTGLLALEALCTGGFIVAQLGGVVGGGGRLMARLGMAPNVAQAVLEGLDRALRSTYLERWPRLLGSVFYHFLATAMETLEIYLVVRLLAVPISVTAALGIGAFGSAVRFFSFMIPASLGALEGANVALFAAFGVAGTVGFTCTLVRRLREILWIAVGFAALSLLSARRKPHRVE